MTPTDLTLPPLDFAQRFVQLLLQLAHIEADGAGAVQNGDADHHEIQGFSGHRLVPMRDEIVIDPLLESVEISQAGDRRKTAQRARIQVRRRESDAARIDERYLISAFKQ
jgi:hypothetical protein